MIFNMRGLFSRFNDSGLVGNKSGRDRLLDFSKAVAIILVVIGHTIQGQAADFDSLYGFRFIYSFHMPLFALLAGASAAFWVKKIDSSNSIVVLASSAVTRVRRSAEQLLIPFISWTLISYWVSNNQEPIKDYAWKIFKQPDYSLWFLPCIFWCTTYAAIFVFLISVAKKKIETTRFANFSSHLESPLAQAIVMFLIWKILATKLPSGAGLFFANSFHGGLFVFYLIGLACFNQFVNFKSPWLRALPYIAFFCLVPFWHRTLPFNIIDTAPATLTAAWLKKYYAITVAITGSLVFIDIARILYSVKFSPLNLLMIYIGGASLGIYAIHFYFVSNYPPVIAPIVISLIIWQTALCIPVVRKVLFGK